MNDEQATILDKIDNSGGEIESARSAVRDLETYLEDALEAQRQAYNKLENWEPNRNTSRVWIVLVGTPTSGFSAAGPFPTERAAEDHALRIRALTDLQRFAFVLPTNHPNDEA